MREVFSQPSQATRRWPCSSRCSVAMRRAVGAVDVGPARGPRRGVVPGPAEGDEGGAALRQEAGLRRAGVGVGHHEGVDGGRAQQVVVAVQRVLRVTGEQQHVVAGARGGLDQAVQEPVHQRVAGALLGRLEAQADQVRGAGAQLAGRPVRASSRAARSPTGPAPASRGAAARGCSARWRRSGARRRPRRRPWPVSEASPGGQWRPRDASDRLSGRVSGRLVGWLMRLPGTLGSFQC